MSKPLTLSTIAENPEKYKYKLSLLDESLIFRPLQENDIESLTKFLEGLSENTRRLSTFPSYDLATAQEFCKAINKYDKLRFVIENQKNEIVGLMEFSFHISEDEKERFKKYKVQLTDNVCRFGPTLSDAYQDKGLGSIIFPYIINIAKEFNMHNIILYGGVLSDNTRAIRFYEKNRFTKLGTYINSENKVTIDMILNL